MKDSNKILRFVYMFFLGIVIALFIGIGTNTFYPQPKAPVYPESLNVMNNLNKQPTEEQLAVQQKYDNDMKNYHETKLNKYNRNVSMFTLGCAVLLLAISLLLESLNIKVITDGVMFGGLFTLIYSIGRGVASQDSKYMFIAIAVSLVVVVYLGYHRFVRAGKNSKKRK